MSTNDVVRGRTERPRLATAHRILLADDNAVLRASVGGLLRSMGHRVDVVRDGTEAVEAIAQAEYDLVLLDIQMPVMGGIEAAALIRLQSSRPPWVVAVSADVEGLIACEENGIDAVLPKPIRVNEIARFLNSSPMHRS